MTPDDAVVAIINESQNHKVRGRKRLQKFAHLLSISGETLGFDFNLHYYGPFSRRLENEVSVLSFIGMIDETAEVDGSSQYLSYVYTVSGEVPEGASLSKKGHKILKLLERHSTRELEGASTVAYLLETEELELKDAKAKATSLKPYLSDRTVMSNCIKILEEIGVPTN